MWLQKAHVDNTIFGASTFKSLYNIFNIEVSNNVPISHQWFHGYWLGNVFTGLAALYADFNFFGTFLYLFFFSLILNYVYIKIRNACSGLASIFSIILYSYVIRAVLLIFFDNYISTTIFSVGFLIRLLIWFFALFILNSTNKIEKIHI